MLHTITDPNISTISSLIQLSVAPVFLLAGVAGLLNVFTSRLTRTIDKFEAIDKLITDNETQDKPCTQEHKYLLIRRGFLLMRIQNTNWAIFFATITGLMVALVIISVFFSSIVGVHNALFISITFILAMIFLIISLVLFLREIYFTNLFIKTKKEKTHI